MASSPAAYRTLLLCGLLFIAACTAGITPAAATTPDRVSDTYRSSSTQDKTIVAQTNADNETASTTNNSTEIVRYVNPKNYSTVPPRATRLERAGLEIAESLGIRLEVSANKLVEQNYTAAESQLGEAYQNDVVRFTQIAEATENASDDQLARALNAAGENQRGAVNNAEEFRTLYGEYQQARASQNKTRAREIAQELAATTAELNQSSTNLTAAYSELAAVNKTQAERAQRQIEQALTQAEQISENAQQSTYIETQLSIDSVSEEPSPDQPLIISGTLQDANGTALADRTVRLETPQGRVQTQTNATGAFNLSHIPTQMPAGTSPITVRYVPQQTAGYLGSETTVSPRILSLPSTLTVTSAPSTFSNTSTATITGDVQVADQTIDGVPVRAQLGETVIGETETNETGAFRIPVSVPITTPSGDTTLTVEAGGANQAVRPTTEQRSVTVEPVTTDLTLSATRTNTTTVAVDGRLIRADGQPLAAKLLTITVENQTVGYLQTDSTGGFASEFTLTEDHPAIDGTEQTTTVSAEFTGGTTHLEPAQASTTVTFFPIQGLFGFGVPALTWAFGAAVGLFLFGSVVTIWWFRVVGTTESTPTESPEEPDVPVPSMGETDAVPESPTSLFERAETVLDSSPEQALQVGYRAARQALATKLDAESTPAGSSATHWEFYWAVETTDTIDEELTDAFKSLTLAYEQSTYTTESTTQTDVQETLRPVRLRLTENNRGGN